MSNRRAFIKTSCVACAGIAGSGFLLSLLSSCKTTALITAETTDNIIRVPVSAFADKKIQVVRSKSLEFDVLVVKNSPEKYSALLMKCTHRENPLTATDKGLFCPSHGSSFDLDGNVTEEPASSPLKKFRTQLENETILIYLQS